MDVFNQDERQEKWKTGQERRTLGDWYAMPGTKNVPAQGKVQDVMTKLYSSSDQTRLQAFTGLA